MLNPVAKTKRALSTLCFSYQKDVKMWFSKILGAPVI